MASKFVSTLLSWPLIMTCCLPGCRHVAMEAASTKSQNPLERGGIFIPKPSRIVAASDTRGTELEGASDGSAAVERGTG